MIRRLRNYFLSGLLVVTPIGVTIWIIWGIFNLFDSWYRHLSIHLNIHQNLKDYYRYFPEYGIGFFLTITLIILIGILAQLYIGKKMLGLIDQIFLRIPGISNLYNALKQITETFMGRRKQIFEQVVLFEYPRRGLYSLGFVTGHDNNLIEPILNKPLVYVFVATTPNPTSGLFLIVPVEDLIPLDLGVEDAMKMIISGGMVAPRRIREVPLEISESPAVPENGDDKPDSERESISSA